MKKVVNVFMKNCVGVSSKTGNEFNYVLIELIDDDNHKVSINDYNNLLPFDMVQESCTLEKNDKGRYVIVEFDYYIPYQYNLAVNVLCRTLEDSK